MDRRSAESQRVSILVVLDQAARHGTCTAADVRRCGFQSLLSWIRLLGQSRRTSLARTASGFNPCCLGSGCSASGLRYSVMVHARFQSLLSWIRLLGRRGHRDVVAAARVSILVVLDQAARPSHAIAPRRRHRRGFNPCCLGSGCSAVGSATSWRIDGGFNPCCLGSGCSALAADADASRRTQFQSLLSWIRLLGNRRRSRSGSRDGVSILVVLDQAARLVVAVAMCTRADWVSILVVLDQAARRLAGADCRRPVTQVSILVVLDQAARPAVAELHAGPHRGFNPCCLGSGCSARLASQLPGDSSEFQSLLSWIRLLGPGRRSAGAPCTRFQSLLSWIRLLGQIDGADGRR